MKKMSWPLTVQGWKNNKELTKDLQFINKVSKVINRRKYKYFRVHAMGEFDTVEYLLSWYAIAKNCPDTKFYAYSKEYDIVSFCADKKPDNFTMIKSYKDVVHSFLELKSSVDHGNMKGFDSKAIICGDAQTLEIAAGVCQASKHKGNDYCMNKCTRCANKGEIIVLPLH
jgi:hypothetical protein